ncbi:MAG: phage protein GemA/Gp16 family protein [Candidatus Jordarchaeales archaeon]
MPRIVIEVSEEEWATIRRRVRELRGSVRGMSSFLKSIIVSELSKASAEAPASKAEVRPSTSKEEKKVEPMTERQREYIKSLLKKVAAKLGKGYEALAEEVAKELGFDPREGLTKDQASKVIEWLESRLE